MTRQWPCTVVAMLCVLLAVNSHAFASGVFYDGNKLMSQLKDFERAERSDPNVHWEGSGLYMGFVLGVHDTISGTLCATGDVPVRQVTAIVAKYLNERPAEWSKPAYVLVAAALRSAFRC